MSDDIIRLALRGLGRLYRGALINVALVVDIEFAESFRKAEDVILLELRIFPGGALVVKRGIQSLQPHLCSLRTFMIVSGEPAAL